MIMSDKLQFVAKVSRVKSREYGPTEGSIDKLKLVGQLLAAHDTGC